MVDSSNSSESDNETDNNSSSEEETDMSSPRVDEESLLLIENKQQATNTEQDGSGMNYANIDKMLEEAIHEASKIYHVFCDVTGLARCKGSGTPTTGCRT